MVFKKRKKYNHRKTVHDLVDHLLDKEKRVKRGGSCPRWFPRLLTIPRFIDHMGRYKEDDGRECVTGEPYGMDSDTVRSLVEFCDRNNFDFHISANSTYYPGATVLVRIFPKDNGWYFV